MSDQHFADNRANWDDRVPIHLAGDLYDFDGFAEPGRLTTLVEFDRQRIGPVAGKRLVHLQCHLGTDTLSWARLGAEVTGLDFSEPALVAARGLAERLDLDARFVFGNVYDAVELLGETYDIVYTGVGALCWLPDIGRWADVVAGLTEPGGTLYIKEAHPMLWTLDDERADDQLNVTFPYFERPEPTTWDFDETYGGVGQVEHSTTHLWNHGIGEIVMALLDRGFRLDLLEEHRELDWQGLPHMVPQGAMWVLPDEQRDLVPLMYSLRATKVD